jgi:dsRNA-specific ribonuclease
VKLTEAGMIGPYSFLTDVALSTWWELRLNNSTVAEGCSRNSDRAQYDATQAAIKLLRAEADRLEQED